MENKIKNNKLKRIQLRNKLDNILRKANLKPCKNLQSHLLTLSSKMNNFYEGEIYQSKILNNSLRFIYSNHKDEEEIKRKKINDFYKEYKIDFSKEKDYVIKILLSELSIDEIKLISRDADFYIKDDNLRELLGLFDEKSQLYQTLAFEEKIGKVENEDDRIKRLIKNKKIDLINRNNSDNSKHFKYKFLKSENDVFIRLKEKIKQQKKLVQKKKFLNDNHMKIINHIISDSQRDINNTSKYLSKNHIENLQKIENLKNMNNNTTPLNKTSYRRVIKLNDNIILSPNSKKKIKFNNFSSFSNDKNNKQKEEEKEKIFNLKKFKKNLLERESQNFLNVYTTEIKKIFHDKAKSIQLPKINKKL